MSKFNFNGKAEKFRSLKSVALEKMANNAINQFKVTNFDFSGFVDATVKKWKARKDNSDLGRKLLVKTGRLRQSITVVSRTPSSVKVGTNVPYAEFINDGTAHMPARQIMGKSAVLTAKNQKVVNELVRKSL